MPSFLLSVVVRVSAKAGTKQWQTLIREDGTPIYGVFLWNNFDILMIISNYQLSSYMKNICLNLVGAEKSHDVALLLLRIALGVVFLAHGVQKLMGMDGTIGFFASLSLPAWIAWAVAILETLAGAMMLLGMMTNLAGWIIAVIMVGAVVTVHWEKGFWGMNGGYEFNFVLFLVAIAVAHLGHGRYAVCKCGGCGVCGGEAPKK